MMDDGCEETLLRGAQHLFVPPRVPMRLRPSRKTTASLLHIVPGADYGLHGAGLVVRQLMRNQPALVGGDNGVERRLQGSA